ncbi:hypothetical protein F441_19439 [Phytophthora nicotianae CJ01A1]|nr:hypothetical protein F441_19439 [Phytophthora nicotianae CJ01A1]
MIFFSFRNDNPMLRRHPTRVEERADVAAEYEAYLIEKESKNSPQQLTSAVRVASESMATKQETRRQEVRARIGLDSSN